MEYVTKNHSKFLILYHFIFVVKYRKGIIANFPVKEYVEEISKCYDFSIQKMEVDKDHIHFLIQSEPKISPLQIVKTLKSISTKMLWKNHKSELLKYFWKEHTFWSDGYFVSSIGNVSEKTIRKYIEEQG